MPPPPANGKGENEARRPCLRAIRPMSRAGQHHTVSAARGPRAAANLELRRHVLGAQPLERQPRGGGLGEQVSPEPRVVDNRAQTVRGPAGAGVGGGVGTRQHELEFAADEHAEALLLHLNSDPTQPSARSIGTGSPL